MLFGTEGKQMKKMIKKVIRRLAIKNRYFFKKENPRKPVLKQDIELTFTGQNGLVQMSQTADVIFGGFNNSTSVLIKINLNSALNYPASVSIQTLETLIEMLKSRSVKKICIADCTAVSKLPTKSIMLEKGLFKLKGKGIKIKSLDFGPWRKIDINKKHFSYILIPKAVFSYDRIINLSNLKTHGLAGFSAATKNLVGFIHPYQRFELHKTNLEERICEIPASILPDINIIDARQVFVSGGPDYGEAVEADTIIIDSNLVRADIKAYQTLVSAQKKANINGLPFAYEDNIILKTMIKDMEYLK